MPIKLLRLGFTECSLLFIYWLNKYKNINNNELILSKNTLIKWLYTTSGYYDNKIKSNYMDAVHENIDPELYTHYMETLLNFIKDSDNFNFCLHQYKNNIQHFNEFKSFINPKTENHVSQEIVYDFIKDKNILIISPFSILIKNQIESGNVKVIYHTFPNVGRIYAYKNEYTFFNKGPDNNIFETAKTIVNNIKNSSDEFDCVLISCGAYGCLVANELYDYGKNVCLIGGDLQTFFGILNGRTREYFNKNSIKIQHEKNWITQIPDEYKPKDYMNIENGCYW